MCKDFDDVFTFMSSFFLLKSALGFSKHIEDR